MAGLSIGILGLTELFVSAAVHLLFGLYIFSSALASDLCQAVTDCLRPNVFNLGAGERKAEKKAQQPPVVLEGSPPPIVLVHGIFGFGKGRLGSLSYFAGAEKKDERVLVPDLGSLTSIHDRAKELFYYLKGGQVDYGEEHSRIYGHSQLGKIYEQGHYPSWDEHHPLHFVGHSAGAQVVRVLQQMLADKAFNGYDTSEDWVLSLTSLSGALNGTTRAYLDGMQPEDGRSLKPVSLLQICRLGSIIYDWLEIPWLKNYYNFGFDHFRMGWRNTGISGLVDLLFGNNTGPFASGDWILPDLTIQGSIRLNSGLQTFPNTFYYSYATKRTRKVFGFTIPSSVLGIHPMLFLRALQMCRYQFPMHCESYKGFRDEDWEDNDGAINTVSMTHPRLPVEHPNKFVADDSKCLPLQPGIWYYKMLEADHIFFIVNRDRAGVQFDLLYDAIFQRCRNHMIRNSTPVLPDDNGR